MFNIKQKTPPVPKVNLVQKLSRDEINELELKSYDGPIEVVRTQAHMLEAVRELKKETLLGFDTETRPAFKKGVSYPTSLLQLAGDNTVYIFQLQFLDDFSKLFSILANKKIIKAGVSIADDVKELQQLAPFNAAGFVDLGKCARDRDMMHHGLRGLAALLLGFRITKSGQRYNWSRPRLNNYAIKYAATDAWIGRKLYLIMKEHGCL